MSIGGFAVALGVRSWSEHLKRRRKTWTRMWDERFQFFPSDRSEGGNDPPDPPGKDSDEFNRVALQRWIRLVGESPSSESCREARRWNLPDRALGLLTNRRVRDKLLAVHFLGLFGDTSYEQELLEWTTSSNTTLTLVAYWSLVQLDPDTHLLRLAGEYETHPEWDFEKVAQIVSDAPPVRNPGRMVQAILDRDFTEDSRPVELLEYLPASVVLNAAITLLDHPLPEVLAKTLQVIRVHRFTDCLADVRELLSTRVWFLRVQAARTLGVIGRKRDWKNLLPLLEDTEWWVRYRAAQSIARLTQWNADSIRTLAKRMQDPYARDILNQVAAESP